MKILDESKPVVTYRRDKDYTGQEGWRILVDGQDVGLLERPTSATRAWAEINGKNVYRNGFDSIRTGKMFIKDFIRDYI